MTDKKNSIEEQDAQSLAAAIALRHATQQYGIKHAISFHRSIRAAESFTNLNLQLNSSNIDKIDLTSYHISSKKSAGQRSQLLDDFKTDNLALMTNARCLTEGVDVPSIDCVLFADPKQSIVDIVQAAGRALRVSPGKKYGYIMMPLIVPDNMELEEFTETTPFKQVARIIAALSTQDERIVEEFRLNDQGKISSERRIEISGSIPLGLKFDISSFASSIEAKYWERVARVNPRDFLEARSYVSRLRLRNSKDWNKYCTSGDKPFDIPSHPRMIYKNLGYVSVTDWLGSKWAEWIPYKEASEYVRKLNLTSVSWLEYTKSSLRPRNIPANPNKVYKNNGWTNWTDFLGTGHFNSYQEFQEARQFVRSLGISTRDEWIKYCRSGNKPLAVPSFPSRVYKGKGWLNWSDWLGSKNWMPYDKARRFVIKQNIKSAYGFKQFSSTDMRPNNIPTRPDISYRNRGWIDWNHFLGKK